MTPRARRMTYARMGIADPIPSVSLQRLWAWIDNRIEPEGDPDGQFHSHTHWINKASSHIGWTGAKCFDAKGRPCNIGADFMRADKEGAYPVSWYLPSHFDDPMIPTQGQYNALVYFHQNPRSRINDIRTAEKAGQVTWNKLEQILGEGSINDVDDYGYRTLTTKGREEIEFIIERARRASYVR